MNIFIVIFFDFVVIIPFGIIIWNHILIYYINILYILFLFISDNRTLNNFIKMFFGNANFAGAMCAFFLDNTVPGRRTLH